MFNLSPSQSCQKLEDRKRKTVIRKKHAKFYERLKATTSVLKKMYIENHEDTV